MMSLSQELMLLPNVGQSNTSTTINRMLKESNTSFGETLSKAISDVNSLQGQAGKAVDQLVSGETADLHEVMIAVEKAKTSFELLMEIRNKTIDAYREIMRMQV
jgi:flagellar hook-basal body complex protein FliE